MSKTNGTVTKKRFSMAAVTVMVKEFMTLYISAAILIFMGWCIYYLLVRVEGISTEGLEWERYLYLVAVVEGFSAFAIGFLFGEKVNKKGAETAEANVKIADKTKLEADKLKMDIKTGKLLLEQKAEIEKATESNKEVRKVIAPRAAKIDAELKTLFEKY